MITGVEETMIAKVGEGVEIVREVVETVIEEERKLVIEVEEVEKVVIEEGEAMTKEGEGEIMILEVEKAAKERRKEKRLR